MAFALDPRRCDPEVWKHGTPVLMTHSIPKEYMDDWCSKVSEQAEAQVDWSFAAGRIVVRALGNLERVRKVMRENLKELADHQRAGRRCYCGGDPTCVTCQTFDHQMFD